MDLYFLGTSSGTPTRSRNVTAIAIIESQGKDWYLVDCGEGTQHQILQTRLSLNSLAAIFITHVHGDHCYGLPGLLGSAGMGGRTNSLKIIAPEGIKEWYESTLAHTRLHLPFEIEFERSESLAAYTLGQFSITTIELSHRVPSFAYIFTELNVDASLNTEKLKRAGIPRGPLWGKFKAGENVEHEGKVLRSSDYIDYLHKPRKFMVCGDNDNPSLLRHECSDCHILVHESTYTEDLATKAAENGHSYAKEVASIAQKCLVPNLVLTHFSPRYQNGSAGSLSIEKIRSEAKSEYTGNLYLASDFDRFRLDKSGQIELIDCVAADKGSE